VAHLFRWRFHFTADLDTLTMNGPVSGGTFADICHVIDTNGRTVGQGRGVAELRETGMLNANKTVKAVLCFLERLDHEAPSLPPDFDPTAWISFEVGGRRPTDLLSVRQFWQRVAVEGTHMQCLVCGQDKPAMERLDVMLKGIPGGKSGGVALISANADAFLSYGLEASYVAPTCHECSGLSMKAANRLIAGENTHLRLGNLMYILWPREVTPFSPLSLLDHPESSEVQQLLSSVFRRGVAPLDPTPFYAAALTATGGRAVVRDWIDTTVGRAQENLARFSAISGSSTPGAPMPVRSASEWASLSRTITRADRSCP
jgi:CRISPR-associated protein Csd1